MRDLSYACYTRVSHSLYIVEMEGELHELAKLQGTACKIYHVSEIGRNNRSSSCYDMVWLF